MFRFAETDMRMVTSDIKLVDESIHVTLKASVPGLIGQAGEMITSLDEVSSGKHRNLIPANAFNVTTLFQPTVAFIDRAASIAPSGFEEEPKAFGMVLEDFVVRVFLPRLDERVTGSFQSAVSGYDAYQLDRNSTDADKPPLKSSVRVMALIHDLCFMLETTPFHRENYSRLIVGVIVQYYQQCSNRFKGEDRVAKADVRIGVGGGRITRHTRNLGATRRCHILPDQCSSCHGELSYRSANDSPRTCTSCISRVKRKSSSKRKCSRAIQSWNPN